MFNVTRSLVLCVLFCRSLIVPFVLFLLTIVLSVLLRFKDSEYLFGIFKHFYAIGVATRVVMVE
jgi:hypothetical protein